MAQSKFGQSLARGVAIACVLGLVVAGGLWWTLKDADIKRLTAYFPTAVGLYEGNSVRVLGVDVGEVTGIVPEGDKVKVDIEYERGVEVPAEAQAVIVAPSLVSDRYVQLAPAFSGGPQIEDGSTIPLERTAVPLEVDDLYASLSQVSQSLGPNGANKDGSLSNLLGTLSDNFQGNGQQLHDTITKLGQAAGTLSGNKGDLFATIENLASFSDTLAQSDGQVRQFEQQLADVSGFLAGERGDLSETVTQLGDTLGSVQGFVEQNRGRLKSNVDKLASVSRVLVDQRGALAEILDVAPVGLGNLVNTYNAASGTLDARPNLNELAQPPIVLLCRTLQQTPEVLDLIGDTCNSIAPLVQGVVPLPSPAEVIAALQRGELPPLPLPLAGQEVYGSRGGGQ
ncbi:ABC transporter substrate-binding protein [Amycolatopsis antarctica]|uniref:ABC transporter substrate-binding protein n=1 Tax=Amycolatopsis antarctica TaxID=1854586 RepID=A0A263D8N6_9PSEU|nr:MCE family protein [Amycolatopsis antarctica]OZM74850.1 ABC transporter substrate-binding protein [Amycolatopsis antarctica]